MWELRLIGRDPRRELVGFASGGDVAVTAEGQEIRGTVVGGAPPAPGQPVLVTGEPGNWAISGLTLDPLTKLSPTNTPQLYDRKGCGKCWKLAEFWSRDYLERRFEPTYREYESEPGASYPFAQFVDGRLESVKIPRHNDHALGFEVLHTEPCLALNRTTGAWAQGRFAAPLPDGFLAEGYVIGVRQGGAVSVIPFPIQVDGTELRARWSGIPHTEHIDSYTGRWVTSFRLVFSFPYDAPTVVITELEMCLGSQGYSRVASEQ